MFIPHVIGGKEVPSIGGQRYLDVDPWLREPYAEVARGDAQDVERAVTAARAAFDSGPWPKLGSEKRQGTLHRLADLIEEHAPELAEADSRDMGKPVEIVRTADVARSAANIRFFADHARLSTGDIYPMDSGHHAYSRFEPAGVVAAISPWNFPLMLATWKVAPALAWGNTVVLKPAEDSPASAHLLACLALEAGVPDGVLNVVQGFGPGEAGEALVAADGVDRVTFTGSSVTGREVGRLALGHLVPVSLELGGKGANIVFADADIDQAVAWSIRAVFSNSGQVCLAGSRMYVQRDIAPEFMKRFTAAAESLRFGNPMDPSTELGPLASEQHFGKVSGYLDLLRQGEGEVVVGGTSDGWFVTPTVVTEVAPDSRLITEEIFGPIVSVQLFDTEEEAVTAANDTRYGLNAMLFTENLSRAHRVARALRAGTVWVNCFFIRDLRAPFGGVGESGVGREGGNFSREFFTEPKAIVVELHDAER